MENKNVVEMTVVDATEGTSNTVFLKDLQRIMLLQDKEDEMALFLETKKETYILTLVVSE